MVQVATPLRLLRYQSHRPDSCGYPTCYISRPPLAVHLFFASYFRADRVKHISVLFQCVIVAPPTFVAKTKTTAGILKMLSTEKARHLLKDVQFPGDEDNAYRIAVSGKLSRIALISGADDKDRRTAGAIEIQRIWRGFRTREKYTSIIGSRQKTGGKDERKHFPLLSRRYQEYLDWCTSDLGVSEGSTVVMTFRDYCARVIQVWWRTAETGNHGDVKITKLTKNEAAQKIKKNWKGYKRKKIFTFYKNLIDFRDKGDPSVLLKTINPKEAKLLDKASGGCVRFRLGGADFPPNIYYKIFTSQAIVDVCSYSPRDYTAMSCKSQLERDRHNHGGRNVPDGDSNWYKRFENNGWRLVTERFFQGRLQDSITVETSVKRQPFHYSSIQRQADVERKRKRNKIEWMKKLYKPGRDEGDIPSLPVTATEEMVRTDLEEDIDDLLEWTHGLNYDDYISDWSQIATSATVSTIT